MTFKYKWITRRPPTKERSARIRALGRCPAWSDSMEPNPGAGPGQPLAELGVDDEEGGWRADDDEGGERVADEAQGCLGAGAARAPRHRLTRGRGAPEVARPRFSGRGIPAQIHTHIL